MNSYQKWCELQEEKQYWKTQEKRNKAQGNAKREVQLKREHENTTISKW
ncbi:hypothetical protein MK851_11625 [Tenacibaculum sp. 1B UA]|jgi:hypothetical protein|nr:hypothetical protein [Tenacibaculum sp. 1B UA]MDX8554269.1 hypothetical protein [Tenacibaculum sp. 1B UA]